MTKIDILKISKMYDFLYEGKHWSTLNRADGAFVFGRADPLVAQKVSEMYNLGFFDYAMITGGIGKDSGWLTKFNIPEAAYQGTLLIENHNFPQEKLYLEQKATNGGECCRFGIDKIVENNLPHDDLMVICHSTSLKRVGELLETIAEKEKNFTASYQRIGTDYDFNPENIIDQKEATAEMLRLADWPAKGWLRPQKNLPENLVEYARELNEFWKK